MKIIHSLGFCHLDIKYENIGFSKIFNKFVFLDFGFSKSINEPIGYKSFTLYSGTFSYSSDEMKKLFLLKKKGYVDLYYNDLYCLLKTIK
jgi:serine/threonine protein kinase